MADYQNYRTLKASQIPAQSLDDSKLSCDARHRYCVKYIYGCACRCSAGCCCNWTVPANVRRVNFELWGAGGNGAGACATSRCHHYGGAGGGHYSSKFITTTPGCGYTICAGGVYRCLSRECTACDGCPSYVNGYNLSGFCALGGYRGEANTSWTTACFSTFACCQGPTQWGSDFGMGNHTRGHGGMFNCHCHRQHMRSYSAPFIGGSVEQQINVCWIRCACWIVPYGHGGQSAMSTYCTSTQCCGQGGTGGPGLVRITYA